MPCDIVFDKLWGSSKRLATRVAYHMPGINSCTVIFKAVRFVPDAGSTDETMPKGSSTHINVRLSALGHEPIAPRHHRQFAHHLVLGFAIDGIRTFMLRMVCALRLTMGSPSLCGTYGQAT